MHAAMHTRRYGQSWTNRQSMLLAAGFSVGCALPPVATEPPASHPSANVSVSPVVSLPENPAEKEAVTYFGLAPGEDAIMDWTRNPDGQTGVASLRLPNGLELNGTWVELSNDTVPSDRPGRVTSPHPIADPSDPMMMPSTPPLARQWTVRLHGGDNVELQCTVPIKRFGGSSIGTCNGIHGERFNVRLR